MCCISRTQAAWDLEPPGTLAILMGVGWGGGADEWFWLAGEAAEVLAHHYLDSQVIQAP